jgi:hypothetical protein
VLQFPQAPDIRQGDEEDGDVEEGVAHGGRVAVRRTGEAARGVEFVVGAGGVGP